MAAKFLVVNGGPAGNRMSIVPDNFMPLCDEFTESSVTLFLWSIRFRMQIGTDILFGRGCSFLISRVWDWRWPRRNSEILGSGRILKLLNFNQRNRKNFGICWFKKNSLFWEFPIFQEEFLAIPSAKKKKKKKKFWNFENCRYRGKSGKISRNINFRNLESQILKKSLWVSNRKFHKRNFRILKVTDIQEEVFERYRKLLILLYRGTIKSHKGLIKIF